MVCTSSFHYHTPWKFFFTPSLHFLENLACHQVNVGLFISQQPSGPASDLIPLSFPNHLLLMSTHCYFNPGCNDITDFWNPCQLFVNNFACSLAPFPIFSSLNRAFYFFFFFKSPFTLGHFLHSHGISISPVWVTALLCGHLWTRNKIHTGIQLMLDIFNLECWLTYQIQYILKQP